MKTVSSLIIATAGLSAASSVGQVMPQHIFFHPEHASSDFHFPTVRESVAQARKILHLTTIGDLVTSFPITSSSKDVSATENRPQDVGGAPIGLMEYYADCDPHSGNPILLALDIATPYKNYNQGSNISLSIRWWPTQKNTYSAYDTFTSWMWKQDEDEIPTPHTPAALPRFSLHGHLETVSEERLNDGKIQACFLSKHQDSIYWQPGNDIHQSHYAQLVVDHVYWFGGFGDRARIGWLPLDIWQNLTMQEVIEAKLPGERRHKHTSNWWKLGL